MDEYSSVSIRVHPCSIATVHHSTAMTFRWKCACSFDSDEHGWTRMNNGSVSPEIKGHLDLLSGHGQNVRPLTGGKVFFKHRDHRDHRGIHGEEKQGTEIPLRSVKKLKDFRE